MGVFLFQSSARVESLGTALASTTLQAKPAWARGKAKQVPQCIELALGKKKRSKSIPVVHSSNPFYRLLTALAEPIYRVHAVYLRQKSK